VREELLRLIVPSVKAINNYWKARQREADSREQARYAKAFKIILGPAPPEAKTPEPRPLVSRTKPRRARKAVKVGKGQREQVAKAMLKALGDGTPPELRTESSPQSANSLSRVGSKSHWEENDPCPCGSGKKLKECCKFIN